MSINKRKAPLYKGDWDQKILETWGQSDLVGAPKRI